MSRKRPFSKRPLCGQLDLRLHSYEVEAVQNTMAYLNMQMPVQSFARKLLRDFCDGKLQYINAEAVMRPFTRLAPPPHCWADELATWALHPEVDRVAEMFKDTVRRKRKNYDVPAAFF